MRNYYYDSPLDIYSFFHSRKVVGDFLKFMFEEAVDYAMLMEEMKSTKPTPIHYSDDGKTYQIDYQFFIIVVGKWVAKLTKDKGNTIRVMKSYCITELTIRDNLKQKNRTSLAYFFSENLGFAVCRDKQIKGIKSTAIDLFPHFSQKVIEYKDEYYDMKVIGFDIFSLQYYINDWSDIEQNIKKYIFCYGVKQVAYRNKQVKYFWSKHLKETGKKRKPYFLIDDDDFDLKVQDILVNNATL